jgi:Mg-chelatase subunit ChlD
VSAQTDSDDEDVGSHEELDPGLFPSDVTIGWLTDRFVQVQSETAPVVGHRIQTTALVLEHIRSEEDHAIFRDQFQWDDVDYTDADAFSALFEGIAWPLERSLPSSFFETHDLLWLAGTHTDYYHSDLDEQSGGRQVSNDQRFYDLYGHTPFLFAAIESINVPESGSVLELSATVRHASSDRGPIQDGDGDGGYLALEDYSTRDSLRTPNQSWNRGATAEFTGLQHHPRPRLSSALTEVDYEGDLARPKGGSLLRKRGTVDTAGEIPPNTPQPTRHELQTESREMLVGETLPETWDDDDTEGPVQDGINISVVIDTSGSMSEQDTGRFSDGGREQNRLEVAQDSVVQLFGLLEPGNTVSLVQFDTTASVVAQPTLVEPDSREELQNAVAALSADNRTSIGSGMRTGMGTIIDESGPKTMLVLSDGEENEPPSVADVLPDLRNQGIEVYTIGMGAEINEAQLARIAAETGGESLSDPDPGEVVNFFRRLSGDVQDRAPLSETEETVEEGDTLRDSCSIDSSCEDVQFANSYEGSEMTLTVRDPNGNELTEGGNVRHRVDDKFEVWTVETPQPGEWTYEVDVLEVNAPQTATLQANARSPVDGELFVSDELYEQTGFIRIQLKVDKDLGRYTDGDSSLTVIPPGGSEANAREIPLYDDGAGADDVSDDGIYSNYFHPTRSGEYEFRSAVSGGEFAELRREFEATVEIDTVVDEPVRPYEERATGGTGGLTVFGLLGAILVAVWLYLKDDNEEEDEIEDPWS